MIKLLAIAPEDGEAFIDKDGEIWLMRPCYEELIDAEMWQVESACAKHGFFQTEGEFENISSLIVYLEQQIEESWAKVGKKIPTTEEIQGNLDDVPVALVSKYLDELESKISEYDLSKVIKLLQVLGESKQVIEEKLLYDRVKGLLNKYSSDTIDSGTEVC